MRCRNCHTVLMRTDRVCPSCFTVTPNMGMPAPNADIVPGRTGILGEATADVWSRLARVPALKWTIGLFLFLVAGGVMLLGLNCYFSYQAEEGRGPREVTAAELIDLPNHGPMSDPWLSYSFPQACETTVRLEKKSVGNQYAYSRFILVQVQDRWLAAQVSPDFRGNKLVGRVQRLGTWDGASYEKNLDAKIINDIRVGNPDKFDGLLPYQVNAVLPYQSKIRGGYMMALGIALGGLIIGGLGLTILQAKPRPR